MTLCTVDRLRKEKNASGPRRMSHWKTAYCYDEVSRRSSYNYRTYSWYAFNTVYPCRTISYGTLLGSFHRDHVHDSQLEFRRSIQGVPSCVFTPSMFTVGDLHESLLGSSHVHFFYYSKIKIHWLSNSEI